MYVLISKSSKLACWSSNTQFTNQKAMKNINNNSNNNNHENNDSILRKFVKIIAETVALFTYIKVIKSLKN